MLKLFMLNWLFFIKTTKNSYASTLRLANLYLFNKLLYRKFHHLIVYHFQSRSAIARGDMESARSHSSTARQLSNISVIAGVAFLLVGMLIAGLYWFFGVIPNMSSGPQEYQDWSVLEICRETKQCKNDLLFNRLCLTFKLVYVSAARNFALLAAIVH